MTWHPTCTESTYGERPEVGAIVGYDCPSVYAQHQAATACYCQSHGCPRECGMHGYGCFPAGYPADPRDLAGTGPTTPRRRR